jgi:hypothetical protein
MLETRIKYLEMIQAVIARLAGHSFAVKGIAITLATGAIGFAASLKRPEAALAGAAAVLVLWGLDAFYLRRERAFRRLFDVEREKDGPPSFSMDLNDHLWKVHSWISVGLSKTLFWLYTPVIVLALLTYFAI